MALHDLGLVPFEEPFPRIRLGEMILKDGAKMSKSRGNVVTPDEYTDAHGADVLRCALLFSAPWEKGGDFVDDAIAGIERFFARAWRVLTGPDRPAAPPSTIARAVVGVGEAIEQLTFNVGIARLMEVLPHVGSHDDKRTFAILLAPFAPHLAEALWAELGGAFSVHDQQWPPVDPCLLTSERVTIAVQVDGQVRGRIEVDAGAGEDAVVAEARAAVSAVPAAGDTARVVYVAGRIVSFVSS
jgi:leucyl-tRNA synthetase